MGKHTRSNARTERRPSVVVIGGGTGTFTVLSGLKKYPIDLTAIVAMSDNGGSTGVLRDEYGVLPPGDLRQCLVALSEAETYMRDLFAFRFDRGNLEGHSFGNLLISTLEQVTGSFEKAVRYAGEILKIHGEVIPVTLSNVHVVTELGNGKVLKGEHALSEYQLLSRFGIKKMQLVPPAVVNPRALAAIRNADLIIVGPGNLYASLVPHVLVQSMASALARSSARTVFVCNIMNKHGHTDDFTVGDYVECFEKFGGTGRIFDTVLYNTKKPSARLLKKYVDEGEPVAYRKAPSLKGRTVIGCALLADTLYARKPGDMLQRTLIRHDADTLAQALMKLL